MSKRHSQIFSLQLANHDDSFGPRPKPPTFIRVLRWIALTPAVVCFILPSFRIGKQVQRAPAFAIPDVVQQHSVFTIPADPSISTIRLSGRMLPVVKSKGLLLAHASAAPSLDLEMVYRGPDHPWDPKSLLPKLEHPTFDVFSKSIRTEANTAAAAAESTVPEAELKVMNRTDGEAQALCWKKPKFEIINEIRKVRPNIWTPRYASLTATAAGEVVQTGGTEAARDKFAIVYHGGGLYSIYRNIKDFKVRKGDQVKAEQLIATAHAGSMRQPASLSWGVVLAGSEISPESFLQTSTQLCDSM
ncbi:MAG TPA: M23 family metallopeptidase [Bdellovibrionales bacterium]|nr:M23 family metallopeptidase [Bdellovibrionales bacterium]